MRSNNYSQLRKKLASLIPIHMSWLTLSFQCFPRLNEWFTFLLHPGFKNVAHEPIHTHTHVPIGIRHTGFYTCIHIRMHVCIHTHVNFHRRLEGSAEVNHVRVNCTEKNYIDCSWRRNNDASLYELTPPLFSARMNNYDHGSNYGNISLFTNSTESEKG